MKTIYVQVRVIKTKRMGRTSSTTYFSFELFGEYKTLATTKGKVKNLIEKSGFQVEFLDKIIQSYNG
jgi:hypothetical protein